MPIIPEQDLLNEANALKGKALEQLNTAATQEEINQVQAMLAEAEDMVSRSSKMRELRGQATALIADYQADPGQSDVPTNPQDFKAFGEFLVAVKGAEKNEHDPRLTYFASESLTEGKGQKDLGESTGSTGGWLVPTERRTDVMTHIEAESIVRGRANIIPMTRRSIELPALAHGAAANGEPNWFGGMTTFWEGEADEVEESEPKFRMMSLTAWDLTIATHTSNNLLADSATSLSAFLRGPMGFSGAIAWKEDYAFLRGDGVGKPLGVLNDPATLAIARKTDNDIAYEDLVNILDSTLPSSRGVWIANLRARAKLMLMKGPDANPAFLWGNASMGIPNTLLGSPIFFSEKMPAVGQTGDIGYFDFSHYYIGDRQAITIESTGQARWLRSQTSWKAISRVDGKSWLDTPFTLIDGSKISPFVVLKKYVAP